MQNYHKRLSVYNPRVFYTLKPGLNDIFQTNEFKTSIAANSKGLRDDDSSLRQPSIICLGDSYTMGWGVEHSESFAQRLERLSGQKVLNAGIASYGTARQMILLQELDTSSLTHLIIQYCSNDYHENNQYIHNNNRLVITSRAAYDTMVNRRKQATSYFPGKYFLVTTKAFFKLQFNNLLAFFGKDFLKTKKQDEKEHARVFMKLLSQSPIDFSKVKVVVCSVGDHREFGPGFLQQVDSLAKAQPVIFHNNLTVADVLNRLEEKDWYKLDWHLKPAGHQKLADMLWESVRRR
jgi:lysophospholipase L1-like esterase